MDDYKELAERLKQYSYERKGEIAKLTHDAAIAICSLEARINVLEKELKEMKDGTLDS